MVVVTTLETQHCDNIVTTLSDVATKIQPKPSVVTTLFASWVYGKCYTNFFERPYRSNAIKIHLDAIQKVKILVKLNIYHVFAAALVLIRSRRQRREKIKKEEEGVSGFDLYLFIEQLVVLVKTLY